MTTVTRTFTVTAPADTVIDYLKDFSHAEQWDPGTQSCTRTDSGPLAVGATWKNVSKIAGITTELAYSLDQLTDEQLVFVGRNKTATSTDTISVVAGPDGSEITYHANIQMHGLAVLSSPFVKLIFERLGNHTRDRMISVLNKLG